ncbi:hypothetical protein A2641_03125 [Candidatus Nomurabacteria bacterium RIFCSPHIGHO2_01_FULL_37_25]|uniref:Uncharacterized protein n=1 Tax=Candidatus Nomurabacteria bacterium RIFCSPLOWO2_01_FULL_36_16 TaxID=1801767 RepID=A0A1F6WZK9_9BACT|nr:MAG: hypothetical protein A2641_03125 [Candidatus Nomurabacteria bacterium RIFCSPHIGHO2_01_FULL_37_25]OGI75482.1 MAG: hypothetical protein A3D36_02770 [Candidatus Nomurabacteria bacterium RIFCSPHIGHO2_02_FULL_36_29]OGI87320.1 MAG: hypothetical protein A3A91_02390 [Candidatus Nomurabacteria bacterium RIFCSPLOWO2_01_FULL_36_16]OGI94762.1 MAG: hypothetical protein A3I84_02595 [Candidatus Nomurabacteria bacterium RIFCSPLOWO2_02_FULL_36_8]
MNQKGFVNIVLIVVIVTVTAIGGYFAFVKKLRPIAQQPTQTPIQTPTVSPTSPQTKPVTTTVQNPVVNKWKTFQNSRFAFQFEYPTEWSVLDKLDDPYGVNFWLTEKNSAAVIMDVESGINLSVMGVSYCGAYPQDKRCESLKTESDGYVTIDWNVSGGANAMFSSQNDTYGVSFTLHKINSDTKAIFKKVLSTFKFLK